jgi:hypothetical protein
MGTSIKVFTRIGLSRRDLRREISADTNRRRADHRNGEIFLI